PSRTCERIIRNRSRRLSTPRISTTMRPATRTPPPQARPEGPRCQAAGRPPPTVVSRRQHETPHRSSRRPAHHRAAHPHPDRSTPAGSARPGPAAGPPGNAPSPAPTLWAVGRGQRSPRDGYAAHPTRPCRCGQFLSDSGRGHGSTGGPACGNAPPLFGVGLVVGVHHIRRQTAARRNLEPLLLGPRADLRCRRPRMLHAFLNWLRLLRAGSSRLAHRGPFSELHLKLTLILGAQLRLKLASLPFPTLMLQLPQGLTCHRLICGHPPLRAAQPVQQAPPCGRLMLRNRLLLTRPPHLVRRGDLLRCRVLHDPAGHGVLKSDRQANRLPGSSRRRGRPQHHPATVAACPLRA